MFEARYARLFTDESGLPRFEDLAIELLPGFAVPPAEPLHTAAFLTPEGATFWIGGLPSWNGGNPHPAPKRMIFVTVSGEYEVIATGDSARAFPTGSVLLVEDTTGVGHCSRITGTDPCVVFVVGLAAT